LACDAVGRRDECWPAFWEMTERQQYEAGLPFRPETP
jgi:hypothetical protein